MTLRLDARFWAVALFGVAVTVSTGPAFAVPIPMPGMGTKQAVLADLVFVVFLALCALPVGPPLALRARRLWLPAAVLFLAIAVTVAASPRPAAGVADLGRLAYSLTLFVLVGSLRLTPTHVRRLAIVYTSAALVVSAATLAAWLAFRWRAVPAPLLQFNLEAAGSLGMSARALGPFAHPTTFVIFLHGAFFYVLLLLRLAQGRRERALAWITGAVMAVVMPLTYSRAVVGPVVSGFLLSCRAHHASPGAVARTTVLGSLTAVGLVLLVVTHVWNIIPVTARLDPETEFMDVRLYMAKEERFVIYTAAVRMFSSSPLTGVGPGLFGENFQRFVPLERFRASAKYFYVGQDDVLVSRWRTGPDPHSSWFGWLAKSGLVGLGGFVFVFAWVMRALVIRGRRGGAHGDVARVAAAFLVGFLLMGFFVEIVHLKLVWLFMGVALAATDSEG